MIRSCSMVGFFFGRPHSVSQVSGQHMARTTQRGHCSALLVRSIQICPKRSGRFVYHDGGSTSERNTNSSEGNQDSRLLNVSCSGSSEFNTNFRSSQENESDRKRNFSFSCDSDGSRSDRKKRRKKRDGRRINLDSLIQHSVSFFKEVV